MGSIALHVYGLQLADRPSIAHARELANLRRDPCLPRKKALDQQRQTKKAQPETNPGCRCDCCFDRDENCTSCAVVVLPLLYVIEVAVGSVHHNDNNKNNDKQD